jgi:YesN/AraC family two-component response regulator
MEKRQLISIIHRRLDRMEHNDGGINPEAENQDSLSLLEKVLFFAAVKKRAGFTDSAAEDKKKYVVLVVSNNAAVRCRLREVLVPGYVVEEAADGFEGFKLAKKLLPDLVISDFAVPGMDGSELCIALKGDHETGDIPLVLLCGEESEESIIKGFESGADDCIVRPINVNILKSRVKNLVDTRRQLHYRIWRRAILQSAQLASNSADAKFLEQLQHIIEENLSNPLFSVEELCDKLYMSRPSMYRRIRSLTGESPQLFIRSYRLKRAAQLLGKKNNNVTEVCFSVGFTSSAYFGKCFKEKFHQSPKEFARSFDAAG